MEKYLLTVSEAQEYTGIGRDAIYQLLRSGKIDYIKIGRYHKIHKLELERFLDTAAKERTQL
ncbi:MAG: helix-turn-helix domain-containing protein [Ignavibacteria bacterium]|nr:helix-turn-helix domain-containing protein [Ignavibacteria bacterium]